MEAIIKSDDGKELGRIVLSRKQFKTGSVGFHGFGKIEIDGKRHQVNFMLIEIGSKKG